MKKLLEGVRYRKTAHNSLSPAKYMEAMYPYCEVLFPYLKLRARRREKFHSGSLRTAVALYRVS